MNLKKYLLLLLFAIAAILMQNIIPSSASERQPLVYTLVITDTVTAGTAKHVARGLGLAERNGAEAVLILLNTPGGLVTATLDIIKDMSASAVPVITYVSPQGAIAASAGTFILLNGHIAAMSPGTTCGAAMPVATTIPGEAPKAADQKTINFLAGHMRSIARERGRPPGVAEKFVTENLSLNNSEALEKGVVNVNAADLNDLLQKIHGMAVETKTGKRFLNTSGYRVEDLPRNINESFIHLISNPTLSMILLMVGIYGLIIGFYSPGFFLPEILGSVFLVLGLAGVGLFQGNLAAALLILLGAGLLIAELYTPTFGILGVGGLASLVLGIMFFPIEPLMPVGWFSAFKLMAMGVGAVGAAFFLIVIMGLARVRRLAPVHGEGEFHGAPAYVIKDLNPVGLVKIKGEIWQAVSKDGHTIPEGQRVMVYERQGMTLYAVSAGHDMEPEKR